MVKGRYIKPLRRIRRCRIRWYTMGLYIRGGKIAFFRRLSFGEMQWESTGFIIVTDWAQERRLTPCLAFRDAGPYHVSISKVSSNPPFIPEPNENAVDPRNWVEFNWDGVGGEEDGVLVG